MTLLTDALVRDIKRRLWFGETGPAIACDYDVGDRLIMHIRRGIRWAHVPWPVPDPRTREPLTGPMPADRIRAIEVARKAAASELREAAREELARTLKRRLRRA